MIHHSPEAAYGAAHGALVRLLTTAGSEHPHEQARDFLQELQHDGWQWRPRVIPPQRPRHGAPPSQEYLQAKQRLLEELHTEAMANEPAEAQEGP